MFYPRSRHGIGGPHYQRLTVEFMRSAAAWEVKRGGDLDAGRVRCQAALYGDRAMSKDQSETTSRAWTAAELLLLPREQRDAILAEAAARAEQYYRTDPELTAFEAFGEKDLYGDSSDSCPKPR